MRWLLFLSLLMLLSVSKAFAEDCPSNNFDSITNFQFKNRCLEFQKRNSGQDLDENLFFRFAVDRRIQNLECLRDTLKSSVTNREFRSRLLEDVKQKVGLIKALKKEKLKIQSQLNRMLPSTQSVQMKVLEDKKRKVSEAIELSYQGTFLGNTQEMRSLMDELISSDTPEKVTSFQIESIVDEVSRTLVKQLDSAKKWKTSTGSIKDWPDELKASLAMDLGTRSAFVSELADSAGQKYSDGVLCRIDKNFGFVDAQKKQWQNGLLNLASVATPFAAATVIKASALSLRARSVIAVVGGVSSVALLAPGTAESLMRSCTSISRDVQGLECKRNPQEVLINNLNQSNCYIEGVLAAAGIAASALPAMEYLRYRNAIPKEKMTTKPLESVKVSGSVPEKNIFSSNPQIEIWKLRQQGKGAAAELLEQQVLRGLKEGKITQAQPLTKGKSDGYFVKLSNGLEGVWKVGEGWPANGKAEVAASVIDQHLGLNKVPITVFKEKDGVAGTLQLRVNNLRTIEEIADHPTDLNMFDYLIGNQDRHGHNYLSNTSGFTAAIDHGLAFRARPFDLELIFSHSIDKYADLKKEKDILAKQLGEKTNLPPAEQTKLSKAEQKQLIRYRYVSTEAAKKKSSVVSTISAFVGDKKVLAKLKGTSHEDWVRILGDKLTPGQINGVVVRQREILKALERAEKELGPDIYPVGPISFKHGD